MLAIGNAPAYWFRMGDSALCGCGSIESITHYLLQCQTHNDHKKLMKARLLKLNVNLFLKNLLGGGDFPPKKQAKIVDVVAEFLMCTSKL